MLLRNPSHLRQIYRSEDREASGGGVDIVVVPGVWIEYPPNQYKNDCSWIKPLTASSFRDTRVFLFHYHLEVDGSSLWDQLLGQGGALIEGLDQSRVMPESAQRPLLFICHSLGGLIVKKALALSFRSRRAYEDVTSGIVFLGCPHLTTDSAEGWNNVKLIMKAHRKDISKQNMTETEMDSIITTCQQFESLRLVVPILSVCERRETRLRENFFQSLRSKSKQGEVLVTRTIAQIKSSREDIFEADKNHLEICDVEANGPLYSRLIKFFSSVAQYAPKNVQWFFRKMPTNQFKNPNVRTQSSVSSFPAELHTASQDTAESSQASMDTPQDTTDTPQITTDTPQDGSLHSSGMESLGRIVSFSHDDVQPTIESEIYQQQNESVQLPFSHTASISRNQRFVGREDVLGKIDHAFGLKGGTSDSGEAQLHDREDESCRPKVYVLCGMGGIGKTETAIQYLYSRRDKFDAVCWIYADTAQKLGAQFVDLAKELRKGTASESIDEVSAREVVKAWLATPVGYRVEKGKASQVDAKWLIVFDNADSPETLYDWLPEQGPGCILVTGRYPYVRENVYLLGNGLDVEPFSPEFGGKLLRQLSERENEIDAEDTSKRIVELLGGLPLAINQMSAIIRHKHLTLKDFEIWYREDSKDLQNLKIGGMQSNYEHTIGTAFAAEQLDPVALALLRILSVLDADRIPEELLMDGAKGIELPNYPVKKNEYFNARAELIHRALVTRNMAANELRIHRLVQDVVRNKMKESELHNVYAATGVLLGAVWPEVCGTDPTRNQSWRVPIADTYTPHICRLEGLFGPDIREGRYGGTATSGYLFCSYAWYIFERGHPDQTEIFASLAQKILDKAVAAGGSDEERVTHWLGEAHHNLSLAAVLTDSSDGMHNAKTWVEILLSRIEKFNLPSEALSLATAYNQVGICHLKRDEVDEAMNSWKKSLATYSGVDNRPDFSGTFPAISLAQMYALQNRPEEGEKVLMPALEEHERILGKDDKTTTESGHIWRAMGNIRNAQQRYEQGLEYHERAVENMKITLGEKHYFTGDCFYSLALDWMRQGNAENARENLDAAINAFTDAAHREAQAARAMWAKGCLLKGVGENSASEALFKDAMELRRHLQPHDHRPVEELQDQDWTDGITYWSR